MPTMQAMKINGEKVRSVREARFLSQVELAEKAEISLDQVGRIERGVTKEPHFRTIRKLASALGVDPSELVRGGDNG